MGVSVAATSRLFMCKLCFLVQLREFGAVSTTKDGATFLGVENQEMKGS